MTPNVVATPQTKMLALTLLEAARQDSAAQAVIDHLKGCRRGQEAALVACLLKIAVDETDALPALDAAILAPMTPEGVRAEEERVVHWVTDAAAAIFGVKAQAILDPALVTRRQGRETRAAFVVQWVLREFLDLSYPRIAVLTGRRDHTTIINAVQRVEADPEMHRAAQAILKAARYGTEKQEESAS